MLPAANAMIHSASLLLPTAEITLSFETSTGERT